MTVGMPGSGVGGLFYFCLVLFMPISEGIRTLRGRSSLARWRTVAFHWSILMAILLALWGEAFLLDLGLQQLRTRGVAHWVTGNAEAGRSMFLGVGQVAAIGSLITLACIVVGIAMLGFIFDPRLKARTGARAELS